MKITIEYDDKEPEVYEDVKEYFLTLKTKLMAEQSSWQGTYKYLIGSLYYCLKKLEKEDDTR